MAFVKTLNLNLEGAWIPFDQPLAGVQINRVLVLRREEGVLVSCTCKGPVGSLATGHQQSWAAEQKTVESSV